MVNDFTSKKSADLNFALKPLELSNIAVHIAVMFQMFHLRHCEQEGSSI